MSDGRPLYRIKEDYVEPRSDIERQIANIWKEVLKLDRIGVNDRFVELGGDSLRAVHAIAKMEEKLGISVTVIEFYREQTVAGIAELVEKKKSGKARSACENLVPLQPSGPKPPLFLVHAVDGDAFTYSALAKALGNERPIYGFQQTKTSQQIDKTYKVEELAESYIRQMKTVQPRGPFNLAGFSGGGIIAFEMAQQLMASGENVGFLGVIDVDAGMSHTSDELYWRRKLFFRESLFFLEDLNPRGKRRKQAKDLGTSLRMRSRAVLICRLGVCTTGFGKVPEEAVVPSSTVTMPEGRKRMWMNLAEAVSRYVPKPYSGRVTVFRGDTPGWASSNNPAMGWDRLAKGGADTVDIPGKLHGSQLKPPNVYVLAKKINEKLESR